MTDLDNIQEDQEVVSVEEPAKAEEPEVVAEAEEPRQDKSGKWYHRQRCHVPGPRRKRKFAPRPEVKPEPEPAEVETPEPVEPAQATEGLEKPMTLGSVDG